VVSAHPGNPARTILLSVGTQLESVSANERFERAARGEGLRREFTAMVVNYTTARGGYKGTYLYDYKWGWERKDPRTLFWGGASATKPNLTVVGRLSANGKNLEYVERLYDHGREVAIMSSACKETK
jgi:hypothetical protein